MVNHVPEGNQSDNPQLSRVLALGNLSRQVELIEGSSSFESCLRLDRLFFKYLRNTAGRPLAADEKATLVTLAHNRSALTQRADIFLDQCNDLVQLGQQSSDGIEKAYAELLASDHYSAFFKERFRENVERSGGIRQLVEGSISRAKIVLASAHERLQRELEEIEQGERSNRALSDVALPAVSDDSLSDDSLFEGGVAAVGIGLATVAVAAVAVATAPVWIVGGFAFAGGFMIGFGATCVLEAAERPLANK